MLHLFGIAAFCCYFCSAVAYFQAARKRAPASAALHLAVSGLVLHAVTALVLLLQGVQLELNGAADYLFWLSLIVVLIFVMFRRVLARAAAGSAFLAAASLLFGASSLLLHYRLPHETLITGGSVFVLHVLPALLAAGCLAAAFLAAVMLLLQHASLKNRPAEIVGARGPSLDLWQRIQNTAVSAGFMLMSAVVLSGAAWGVQGSFSALRDLLTWLSGITWAALAALIVVRRLQLCSARRLALYTASLSGFFFAALIVIAVLGRNALHTGLIR